MGFLERAIAVVLESPCQAFDPTVVCATSMLQVHSTQHYYAVNGNLRLPGIRGRSGRGLRQRRGPRAVPHAAGGDAAPAAAGGCARRSTDRSAPPPVHVDGRWTGDPRALSGAVGLGGGAAVDGRRCTAA